MSQKVYEIITNEIIKKLEEGTVPWKVPWNNGLPVNWVTQKPYRGINLLLLEGGEYATFKQIKDAGGKVKKGAKSQLVVFWKLIEVNKDERETEDEENEKEAKEYRPLLRYYRVFNIDEQVEGLETKRQKTFDHDPIQEAEKIRENYDNAPSYTHFRKGAWYNPIDDRINVPPKEDFPNIHEYYSTLFHEMIHSSGHKDRLNRKGVTKLTPFGSECYSKEELVAEIGASMLCGITGISHETIDNSANYIASWLQALKNDKRLIVHASQQAQKACDYILGK